MTSSSGFDPSSRASTIYRIVSADVWAAARKTGSFAGTEHDRRDGFIHFSTATQLAETAARHYGGLRDLLLLFVRSTDVASALKWEPSRGGALFPHLFAPLRCDAVYREVPLVLAEDGRHVLPPDLP